MPTGRDGSIRLFAFAGIDVFLHWSWFLVAVYEIQSRSGRYSSILWNILEYLALFLIVLLHEFGHALACRQVGGTANRIVLWPMEHRGRTTGECCPYTTPCGHNFCMPISGSCDYRAGSVSPHRLGGLD
jgi:Zn-dependent protease